MYLRAYDINGPANPGAAMIDNIVLEIGGQQIDKHYGHWMETWAELTQPNPGGVVKTVNDNGTLFQRSAAMGGANTGAVHNGVYHIPLQFWFCRNPGLALPLIALQYHEVKVILETVSTGVTAGADMILWADYIYLDTDERRRFAQVSHEYLIEQVQHQSNSTAVSNDLNFNHPVKELIWTGAWALGVHGAHTADNNWQLKLNGHDRFAARDRDYFTITQVLQHHSGFGSIAADTAINVNSLHLHGIAVYSFALKPEEHQPSGTCNFSRIDNAQLVQSIGRSGTGATGTARNVYAVNYNVLRIMSGMGGLAYSN